MTKQQCINLMDVMSKKELYKYNNLYKAAYPHKKTVSNRTIGQWLRNKDKKTILN